MTDAEKLEALIEIEARNEIEGELIVWAKNNGILDPIQAEAKKRAALRLGSSTGNSNQPPSAPGETSSQPPAQPIRQLTPRQRVEAEIAARVRGTSRSST